MNKKWGFSKIKMDKYVYTYRSIGYDAYSQIIYIEENITFWILELSLVQLYIGTLPIYVGLFNLIQQSAVVAAIAAYCLSTHINLS